MRTSLPNDVAFDLVLDFMSSPTAPFGWRADPEDVDAEFQLGSPYTPFRRDDISVKEFVIEYQSYGLKITQDQYNEIRREVGDWEEEVSTKGVVLMEMFAKWEDISLQHRVFFRLGMMGLNSLNDLHNWIIPFQEMVAEEMFDERKISGVSDADGCSSSCYDFDDSAAEKMAELLINELPVKHLGDWFYADAGRDCWGCNPVGLESTTDYLYEMLGVSEDHDTFQRNDAINTEFFDLFMAAEDEGERFIEIFAYCMDESRKAWIDGNLDLQETESCPESVKNFLKQTVLPLG